MASCAAAMKYPKALSDVVVESSSFDAIAVSLLVVIGVMLSVGCDGTGN